MGLQDRSAFPEFERYPAARFSRCRGGKSASLDNMKGATDWYQGVFCSAFDKTGTRLITGGADKTIKVYSEQG